jgi:hypothetical protein
MSPLDSAASFDLASTLPRQVSTENKLSPSLSPLKPTNLQLDIQLQMDPEACSPCVVKHSSHLASRLAQPTRMPPSPLFQQHSKSAMTESAIAKFSVKID